MTKLSDTSGDTDPFAAHIIRRQATTFNRAVSEIAARSRWCLTGTPIQNRLDDIGALFAFIRARPFDNLANFRRYISTPFDETEERREIATKSLAKLIDSLSIRRTRDLLDLPVIHQRLRELKLTAEEGIRYKQTMADMKRLLQEQVGDEFAQSQFGMFQVQLQLRILCNHGTFQQRFSWAKRSVLDEQEAQLCAGSTEEVKCFFCHQLIPVMDSNRIYREDNGLCAHVICSECFGDPQSDSTTGKGTRQCPACVLSGIIKSQGNGATTDDDYFQKQGISTKMEAVTHDVKENLAEHKR